MTHPPSGPQTPTPPPGPKDEPRTIEQAAAELGMSVAWLKKKVSARAVPFRRFGHAVRFFDDDIAEILTQFRETPRPAITPARPITSARRRAAA